MKVFLALGVRKSVSELAFAKSFSKMNFLAKFNFLDLANFVTVDRFLILLPTTPLLIASVTPPSIFSFCLLSPTWGASFP